MSGPSAPLSLGWVAAPDDHVADELGPEQAMTDDAGHGVPARWRPRRVRRRPSRRSRRGSPRSGVARAPVRRRADLSSRSVAASPNRSSSSGTGGRSRSTSLSAETITTNRSSCGGDDLLAQMGSVPALDRPAPVGDLVGPVDGDVEAVEPSNGSTGIPRAVAACSVSGDVATQRRSVSLRAASARSSHADRSARAQPDPHPRFDERGRGPGCLAHLLVLRAHRNAGYARAAATSSQEGNDVLSRIRRRTRQAG